jgi:hypothetical protein
MARSAATSSSACGVAPLSAKPRDRLYPTSSSTIGAQSWANPRWMRHGWSDRQARCAPQIQMNAYTGSVGSPTVTQKPANATAQIDMPITRRPMRRRPFCPGDWTRWLGPMPTGFIGGQSGLTGSRSSPIG